MTYTSAVYTCPDGLRNLPVISECEDIAKCHCCTLANHTTIVWWSSSIFLLHSMHICMSDLSPFQQAGSPCGCAVFVAPPAPVCQRLQIIGWGRRSWAGPRLSWWPAQLANPPVKFSSVTWPKSRDPPWGKPIVLLPSPPHAVGKHSNSWPRTAPETSATSATGENPPSLPIPPLSSPAALEP